MSIIDAMHDRFFREVFIEGQYPLPMEMGTVVDIGSLRAEYAILTYPYAEKIFCIEPHPDRVKELNQLVSDYNLNKITVCPLAISGASEYSLLYGLDNDGESSLLGGDKAKAVRVKCLTMTDFMAEYHIDHIHNLKCDVEGAERLIFTEEFPFDKVDNIFMEVHAGVNNIREILTAHNYNVVGYMSNLIARKV